MDDACCPDAIRKQLQCVLGSNEFDATERNRSFLKYVVEETLEGQAERIKAYNIATSVFGRAESFNPQIDPIVRIEARRLRRSLDRYYLTAGAEDPLRISIPKGGYVPAFQISGPSPSDGKAMVGHNKPELQTLSRPSPNPVIFVSSFEEEGDQSAFPNFTRGFTRQVIVGLTRFSELFVYGPDTSAKHSASINLDRLQTDVDFDFLVQGGTTISSDQFSVEVVLIEASTGRNLWADTFRRSLTPGNIASIRDEVANSIASIIAQPYGIIFSNMAYEIEGKLPDDLDSYDCVIRFYEYWRTYNPELHAQTCACLEKVVERNPQFAEAVACLSHLYTDAYRFGFKVCSTITDPRKKAIALARRAIEIAPLSSRGYHALAHAYWFNGDLQGCLDTFQIALGLNPNDTEIMADLGLRYALLMQWEKAVPLLENSYKRNPAHPDTFRVGLCLYHLAHGQFKDALSNASKVTAPKILYGFVLVAVSAAGLGHRKQAEDAVKKILEIDPNYGNHVIADLEKRHLHPNLIELTIDGLQKAGLTGNDMLPETAQVNDADEEAYNECHQ